MLKSVWKFKQIMEKSHKTCMEQAEIIDTFGTYQQCTAQERLGNMRRWKCQLSILISVWRTHALIIDNSLSNREVHKETSTPRGSVWGFVILAHPRPWYVTVLYIFQPLQRLAIHLVARVLNYFFVVFANKHGLHKIRHLSPIGSSSWHQKSKRYSNQYLQTIASYYYTYNSNLNYLLMSIHTTKCNKPTL